MARRHDRSLAALLLTQRLEPVGAEPLKAAEYWAVVAAEPELETLLDCDQVGISRRTGVDDSQAVRIRRLLDGATAFAFRLDQAEQAGMRVVASVDEAYPESLRALGRSAPPILYAYGQLSLLSGPHLGIVGSSNVGPVAAEVARAAARSAVEHSHGVVSGGAGEVDRPAIDAALDVGGSAVAVLADALQRVVRNVELRRMISNGSLCLCSPYKPDAGYSTAIAMGRAKLIYALSAATLVVASDRDSGATWAGAVEALRQRVVPVLVWTGEGAGPGNEALAARGGIATEVIDRVFPLPRLDPDGPKQDPEGAPAVVAEPDGSQLSLKL